MSPEQTRAVLNSKLAYNVLEQLAKKKEGDYGKRIAEELEKPQASICRTLTNLTKVNFILKGKRTRAQYYEINYEGLTSFWYESLLEELDNDSRQREIMEDQEQCIKEIGVEFFRQILTKSDMNDKLTVSELLYNCFIYSIGEKMSSNEDFFEKTEIIPPLTEATIRKLEMKGFPEKLDRSLDNALK